MDESGLEDQPNIIDVLLQSNIYIIVVSGLECSPINQITEELAQSFNEYVTVLDFMHLPLIDTSNVIRDRLKDVTSKNRVIIVKCKTFRKTIEIPKNNMLVHVNISINDKTVNNKELSDEYRKVLKESCNVDKFFNYKPETNLDEMITQIFYYLISKAEKRVYGAKYEDYKSVANV